MPNVTFYNGFKKAINSTKRPTGGSSTNVKLKGGCSIIHPVFKLNRNSEGINYVKWGSNYYYVDDIAHLLNDEIEVTCTRDPMATFKEDIGSSSQFVARSASAYNGLICDDKYPTYNIANTQTGMISQLQNQISTTGTVVIGIVNDYTNRGVTYYAFDPTASNFKSIMQYLFGDDILDNSVLDIPIKIQKELLNPMQYVVSAMWFPIPTSSVVSIIDGNVKVGWWTSDVTAKVITEDGRVYDDIIQSGIAIPRHPQAETLGLYMNGAPYTKIDLHCWGFGTIPIDPLPFVSDNHMRIQVLVDLYTGVADLVVQDNRGADLVVQSAQFGIPFQLSQITQNLLNVGITSIGSAISSATSFGAGNVIGGTLGLANGIISGVKNSMPQVRTLGSVGSKVQFAITPQLTCQYYYQVPHDIQTLGRPLMDVRTISSLSGYTECINVDLVTSATPSEKRTIIENMEKGFFYE